MSLSSFEETYQAALALELRARYAEAEDLYRRLAEAYPNRPEPWHRLGLLRLRAGEREAARQLWRESLARDGRFAPSLVNLGNLSLEDGELEAAEEWYRRALEADPGYAPAYHNLAVLERRRGRLASAVALWREARRRERRGGCLVPAVILAAGTGAWLAVHPWLAGRP